jgi:hypothetical protein
LQNETLKKQMKKQSQQPEVPLWPFTATFLPLLLSPHPSRVTIIDFQHQRFLSWLFNFQQMESSVYVSI